MVIDSCLNNYDEAFLSRVNTKQTNADIVVVTNDITRHHSCWMEHGRPVTWEMKKLLHLGPSPSVMAGCMVFYA